jgi:NAD(P)-dependent dehydrogenase (short-subunit alcohol dehydrogenase family)
MFGCDKMILIIGANSALSQALVQYFDKDEIFLVGAKNPSELNNNYSSSAKFIATDYRNAHNLISALPERQDITVIFSGIGSIPALLVNAPHQQIEKEISENVVFTAQLSALLLSIMIKANFGRFVFIGSREAERGAPGGAVYSIIKSSQIGLSRSIAVEYARFGITSNVLQLGLLDWGYSSKLPEKEIESLRKRIPTMDSISAADIGRAISLLMVNASINGAVIPIDQAVR